jgi:hypothetical protein
MAQASHDKKARILVLNNRDAPELQVLDKLPPEARVVAIGRSLDDFSGEQSAFQW